MTTRRQPVTRGTRRLMLTCWAVLFISNLGRTTTGNTVTRIISAVMMLLAAVLFISYWRLPVSDAAPPKRSDDED